MFLRTTSITSRLLAATLCVGVTLVGCVQAPEPSERASPQQAAAAAEPAPAPAFDYTADQRADGLEVITARERDTGLAIATLSVDGAGQVVHIDRDDDHLALRVYQDDAGRLVAAGDANGAQFTFAMMPGDLRTLAVTGDSPEVERVLRRTHEAFPDLDALQDMVQISWWECGLCGLELVAIGLAIAGLWPILPALAALIAEFGLAALAALTAAELAALLGVPLALAAAILGPCWSCVQSMMAENPPPPPPPVGVVPVAVAVPVAAIAD